jgi:hypothetical protein
MHAPGKICAFLLLLGNIAYADARVVTLTLPHSLHAGEKAWIEVKVGAIARGNEIDIETEAGRFLGTISPFGIRSGNQAGTYTVPLPADAIADDHVSLRLSVTGDGGSPRPPTKDEVVSVRLKITTAPR